MLRRSRCSAAAAAAMMRSSTGSTGMLPAFVSAVSLLAKRYSSSSTSFIVGDRDRGVYSPSRATRVLNDTVGMMTGGTDIAHRLPAGEILGVMDICAAASALTHISGGRAKSPSDSFSVVTVAVNNTVFEQPLMHGDMVRLVGTPCFVGKSSIGVHVSVYRVQFPSRAETKVSHSLFTMVAVNPENLQAAKVVPALEFSEAHHQRLFAEYKGGLEERNKVMSYAESIEQRDPAELLEELTLSSANITANNQRRQLVSFESTKLTMDRLFFPGHLNPNNTIFGGEIMRWMEQCAVQCGRLFCGNKFVVSIGMHTVEFKDPIYVSDFVQAEAHVVYVRNTSLEVDVVVTVERQGHATMTNKASFVLVNLDEIGQKRPIATGLALQLTSDEAARCRVADAGGVSGGGSKKSTQTTAAAEWIKRYALARFRYNQRREACCRHLGK